MAPDGLPRRGPAYFAAFIGMRAAHPDAWILLTHSLRGDFEARMAACPQRFGIVRPGRWRPLLTDSYRVPEGFDEARHHQLEVGERGACLAQRVGDGIVDQLQVVPGGDLRDHPAIAIVNSLRGDHVGEDPALRGDDRRARVVATGLQGKYAAGAHPAAPGVEIVSAVRHMMTASSPLSR